MAKKKKRNETLKKPETGVPEIVSPAAEPAPADEAAEAVAPTVINAPSAEPPERSEVTSDVTEESVEEMAAESVLVEEAASAADEPVAEAISSESVSDGEVLPEDASGNESAFSEENAPEKSSEEAGEESLDKAESFEDTAVYELCEEKNPELEPIIVERNPNAPIQFSRNIEREKKIAAEVRKRRRRPIVVVLCLCVLLVLAAIVVNAIDSGEFRLPGKTLRENVINEAETPAVTMIVVPTASPVEDTPAPTVEPVVESTYEIIISNLGWEASAQEAINKGGHLATISGYDELLKITTMAEEQGIYMLWIGCSRRGGSLVWENGEIIDYYSWGAGEPSMIDAYDGVSEDYIMLWYNNGVWCYNDSRNDPAAYYPDAYNGKLGYVLEIEG